MTGQEKLEAFLDVEERDLCRLASTDLGSNVLHVIWDSKANAVGMMTTCEDQTELEELLESCLKRVKSGEHKRSRQGVGEL